MPQYSPDLLTSDIGIMMRDEYKLFLAYKYEPKDILEGLKIFFLPSMRTRRDQNLFWLIMARIQVNYGCLFDEVKQNALAVIESGEDIMQWEEYVLIEKHISTGQSLTSELIRKNYSNFLENPVEGANLFLEKFKKLQDEKLVENLQDDSIPVEVLHYYSDESNSKIEVFGNDGKKYLKKRINVIKSLKHDIDNYSPTKKKFSKPYTFDPGWKIGDVYAYKLLEDEDERNELKGIDFYNKYILFEVIGINRRPISRIMPSLAAETSVFIKPFVFIDEKLPDIDLLNKLEYIKKLRFRHEGNYEKLGKFHKDKDEIDIVCFYGEIRTYKKMNLVKLKEGSILHSEVENKSVGCANVFASRIPYFIANLLKKFLAETLIAS